MIMPGILSASSDSGPIFTDFTRLLLHGEGTDGGTTITDDGIDSRTPQVVTVETDTDQFKYGSSSILVQGGSESLQYSDSTVWNLDTEFSLECFVRFNSLSDSGFITRIGSSGDRSWSFQWSSVAGNLLRFLYSTDGSSISVVSGSWSPSVDTWYHVACSRDDSGVIRLFVDGVQVGTATDASAFHNNLERLGVGCQLGSGPAYTPNSVLDGWLDEVRVIVGANPYTSNFTPPTQALPDGTP